MATLDAFQTVRPSLLALARRMLGSAVYAEDVVQEAWWRWQAIDARSVRNPRVWLLTCVSRLCLDRLRSPRVEAPRAYAAPWSFEPLIPEAPVDLESISLAYMTVLSRLGPIERSVYMLHQVFDYAYSDVAEALQMTEAAVRQAFQRAVHYLAHNRLRFSQGARG